MTFLSSCIHLDWNPRMSTRILKDSIVAHRMMSLTFTWTRTPLQRPQRPRHPPRRQTASRNRHSKRRSSRRQRQHTECMCVLGLSSQNWPPRHPSRAQVCTFASLSACQQTSATSLACSVRPPAALFCSGTLRVLAEEGGVCHKHCHDRWNTAELLLCVSLQAISSSLVAS